MQNVSDLEIVCGAQLDADDLSRAMAEAFSDYVTPFSIDRRKLDFLMRQRGFDPQLSAAIVCNGQTAGFWLTGVKRREPSDLAYVITAGVIPRYRRRGIARRLFGAVAPQISKRGCPRIVLEAIETNSPAIKLYESLGFKKQRRLKCYRGTVVGTCALPQDFMLGPATFSAVKEFGRCNWEWPPTWQNDCQSLVNVEESLSIVGAYYGVRLAGYGAATGDGKVIAQICVDKSFRRMRLASAIVRQLRLGAVSESSSIMNIDERDAASAALFENMGWENYANQYEMICRFT